MLQVCKHLVSGPVRSIRPGCRPLSSVNNSIEVCFLDPKTALSPEGNQGVDSVEDLVTCGAGTLLKLPHAFLPDLPKAHHEMGDFDDPMNGWCWGQRGEIFQYNLVGSHSTQSGFTSVILKSELQKLLARRASNPNAHKERWRQLLETLRKEEALGPERIHPFLFVGHIIESARATVYTLQRGKEVEGLLVSSASVED